MRAAKTPTKRATATPTKKAGLSDTSSDRSSQPTPDTPLTESSRSHASADGIISIDPNGDVVLRFEHDTKATSQAHSFQVSSSVLKATSKYFERLLQPGRFEEAKKVEESHRLLHQRYGDIATVPADQLPVLDIQDLGRISKVKAIDALLTDFLLILYGKDLPTTPPLGNLANLAIVADRFDALEAAQGYVTRKKILRAIDGKTTMKLDAALSEEKARQRLLVASLLDYPPWMEKYSVRMIVKGWVGKDPDGDAPLWWDLPFRIEEELAFRRECVLETVQSAQSYFLALYTSRERQCKLGYDSSAQCDSFQLGEMVRFFTRAGTLQFRRALFDTSEPTYPYAGDILNLLDSLRQVPEYQIDRFHSHCGIRTRLVPILDLLQECLQLMGICAECWQNDRVGSAWMDAKKPLLWKRSTFRLRAQGCASRHAGLRELFMAAERDWSS